MSSLAETLFGAVQPYTPSEEEILEGFSYFNHPLAVDEGMVAYALCRGCARSFQVTAERAKEILGTGQLPDESEYIEVMECTLCSYDAHGACIKPKPTLIHCSHTKN